jgi:cobalt-zinc-cadmium efflux system outer membrane protein
MQRLIRGVCLVLVLAAGSGGVAQAQHALTWDEVKARFENNNPTLRAGKLGVDESRAQETTAYLRPNPNLALTVDQINPFDGGPPHSTFGSLLMVAAASYLHERQHKRELRLESAKGATEVAEDTQADLERTLLFTLRMAFVQALQGKAVLALAKENLTYYDKVLEVNRERYKAGSIAQMDLDRLELQRIQYLADLQTADVNLRTAKIQLLALLNEQTPLDQFDVAGPYEFAEQLASPDEYRRFAMESRPDLKAALRGIDKAETDHRLAMANGSTDPTIGFDVGRNPPIDQYIGFNVSVPLRIFDRNQGEKLRTQIDIDRNRRVADAARAQVYSDVDSAYATVNSTIVLLKPYKDMYLTQAERVRDTVSFAYQHGGASLLDFLDAQKEYRDTELNYLNLIGSYLMAASQMNLAVGREVIQ